MTKKTTLLCILDGWGVGKKCENNAIYKAKTPNYDKILEKYPHSEIKTSGLDVGRVPSPPERDAWESVRPYRCTAA